MFWKKNEEKTVGDYYRNELMRSRMSPISVRTDEIIQQYFFATKNQSLTFEEYMQLRALATKELNMIEYGDLQALVDAKVERILKESVSSNKSQLVNNVEEAKQIHAYTAPTHTEGVREERKPIEETHTPREKETPSQSHREPERRSESEDNSFDFLGMMKKVQD